MSKITQQNKEAKAIKNGPTETTAMCQTCAMHSNHPSYCRKNHAYCGRKQAACADYKNN